MTTQIPYPNCPICEQPLSEGEISLNRLWHFDCEKCSVCGNKLASELIEKALTKGQKPAHTACEKNLALARLREKTLPLLASDVQTANEEILAFQSIFNPTTADIEMLSKHLVAMKEHVANVSWMLQLTRDKIRIKESQDFSEKIKTERKAAADTAAKQQEKKIASEERSAMLEIEKSDKSGLLKNWRKAVESTAKAMPFLGREDIIKMVETQLSNNAEWAAIREANKIYFELVEKVSKENGK